jgi:hypothetical protein
MVLRVFWQPGGGSGSVAVFGGIILGRDDQTAALSRTPEYRLDYVDQLLNILILYVSLWQKLKDIFNKKRVRNNNRRSEQIFYPRFLFHE